MGEGVQHRVRDADPGDPPLPDLALGLQRLQGGDDLLDVDRQGGRELGLGALAKGVGVPVPMQVGVQEEEVDALKAHGGEACVHRGLQGRRRRAGPRRSELVLGGELHPRRRAAPEGLTDEPFSVVVHGRAVDEGDPGLDGGVKGGQGFLPRGLPPDLANPATQAQAADVPQSTQLRRPHVAPSRLDPDDRVPGIRARTQCAKASPALDEGWTGHALSCLPGSPQNGWNRKLRPSRRWRCRGSINPRAIIWSHSVALGLRHRPRTRSARYCRL